MAAIAAASRKTSFDSADWKACAAPWKLTAKLGGQIDLGERRADRVDRLAERSAGREVERDRRHRKLLQMRDLQRRRS